MLFLHVMAPKINTNLEKSLENLEFRIDTTHVVIRKLCDCDVVFSSNFFELLDTIVSDYYGYEYGIKRIGIQIWFAENLRSIHYSEGVDIQDYLFYENDTLLEQIYGKLYRWHSALREIPRSNNPQEYIQGVCPEWWYIPNNSEFDELSNYLGGTDIAGGKLKA